MVILLSFIINFSYASIQHIAARDALPDTANELKLDDSFKTNLFTGSFIYSYAIEVPPGTNGLNPEMTVFYASQKTADKPTVLGTGWDFTQTYIQRDINSTLNTTADDKFRLVLEGSSYDLVYSSNDGEYHTSVETFLNIQANNGTDNENGTYWTVNTKDGKTYRLGFNNESESEITYPWSKFAWKWHVDLMNDTYGNSIYFAYRENPYGIDENATYLANISYNNDHKRVVEFAYESSDRPDAWQLYESGARIRYARRLKEIRISYDNSLVRKYAFEYATADTKTRTFLSNITLYGSDNSTSLPATSFSYNPVASSFTSKSAWESPICFTDSNGYDVGTRLTDVNGDGLVDLIRGMADPTCAPPTYKKAYINNGTGWVANSTWEPPICFAYAPGNGLETGVRLVDVNGDGLVDILKGEASPTCEPPTNVNAYINNGHGWVQNLSWSPPLCFSDGTNNGSDTGTRLDDVNGDGLVDIIRGMGFVECEPPDISKAYINNGHGWTLNATWKPPHCFSYASGDDAGTRLVDVNGDRLPDILNGMMTSDCNSPTYKKAFINTGNGWIKDNSKWGPPICFVDSDGHDVGTRLGDMNGDGMIDIIRGFADMTCEPPTYKAAYLNNGSGWVANSSWEPPLCFTDTNWADYGIRLADVDGNGLADIIRSAMTQYCEPPAYKKAYINNGNQSYLLHQINNALGGSLFIEYAPSTLVNNTGNDTVGDIGFNLWVVSSIKQRNNVNGSASSNSTYTYNYSGGVYDYNAREFRGFAFSQETRPDGSKASHYFHQDEARTGREYKTEIYYANSSLYQRKEFSWNFTLNTTSDAYITELRQENTSTFDGLDNPRTSKVAYSYDGFGNVLQRNYSGNINTTGDEKYEVFEYVYNTTSWIIDKPKSYRLLESDNSTKTRETNYSYDNQTYGEAPRKGSVTKKEDFLSAGNSVMLYSHNSYGNLVNLTDPNGRTTRYAYSNVTEFTFPDNETNPKVHVTKYTYNLGTGKVASVMDSNGLVTNYTYDAFGRISKEIRPYDSEAYPTKQYTYDIDGTPPEKVKITQREANGTNSTFDTYTFVDGLGNVVQTKKEAEGSQQIVTDTIYDGLGRVSSKSNPYKAVTQENYTQPDNFVNRTSFAYDAMGRTTKITNPDNTTKSFNYSRWNVTITDENGNKRINVMDAYGRTAEVVEIDGAEQYVTVYRYNAQDKLVNITDSLGNNFTFTYDNLGRKTNMTDPDMGAWSYKYDIAGNLIQQKEGRNVTTDYQYDELNRVIRRNSTVELNFTYDAGMNGTLSRVNGTNFTVSLAYDSRLRKSSETITADNVTLTYNYTYDDMDRTTSIMLSNGINISYAYGTHGKMRFVNGILDNITYNELEQPEKREYNNTLDTEFTYSSQNLRLNKIRTGVIQNLSYAYDNVSNVVIINDTANQHVYRMAYDALNRLVSANRTDNGLIAYAFSYAYNSVGNIIGILSGMRTTYTYSSHVHAPANITETQTLELTNFTAVYSNGTEHIFRFAITNNDISALATGWTLDTGETNISSQQQMSLQQGQTAFVYAYYNYTLLGNYTTVARVRSNALNDTEQMSVSTTGNYLDVSNLSAVHANATQQIFRFLIRNADNNATSLNWTLDTGQANITSSLNITLQPSVTMFTYAYYNYTSSGGFNVTASARRQDGVQYNQTIEIQVP